MKKRSGFYLFLILTLFGGGFLYHTGFIGPAVPQTLEGYYVYIPTGSSLERMAVELKKQGFLDKETTFLWWARKMNLKPRSGRFRIAPGSTVYSIVNLFKNGKQSPVNLIIHGKRTKEDVAGFIARYLELDSITLVRAMNNRALLSRYSCNPHNVMSLFIPNTYQVYWNSSPQQLLDRMYKENQVFWNETRLSQARRIGLSTKEVITLASIVEKETNKDDEKQRIAGVYLNRLKTPGWRLDADPCVIFAWNDFSIRRLTPRHLEIDSPYNTYKYKGLPPGPICMPSIMTIDMTLNAENHNYMFFCAKPDGSGYHIFARTLEMQTINARKYKEYFDANN